MSAEFLAFYLTSVFQNEQWSIKYYGSIKQIRTVRRRNLFRYEPANEKSNRLYYKIELTQLLQFAKPIPSSKGRRLIFVPTTFEKLTAANEVNDLFHTSPLEDKLWNLFKMENIDAERQFAVCEKKNFYFLDFAVFCKKKKLNIECDSRRWHGSRESKERDKRRDKVLESTGWLVVRFSSPDIENPTQCIERIKRLITESGGLSPRAKIRRWIRSEPEFSG